MNKFNPEYEALSYQQDSDDDEIEILEIVGLDEDAAQQIGSDSSPLAGDRDLILDFDETDAGNSDLESATEEREHLVRLQADFENYKKRVDREKEADQRQASARVVQNLLPVLDNFERAIGSAMADESDSPFLKGVQMIFRQILEELRNEGLQAIDTVGQPFDPSLHEAVATGDHADLPHHTIIEEFQRGYTLNERLLRPSLVKVSIAPGREEQNLVRGEGN